MTSSAHRRHSVPCIVWSAIAFSSLAALAQTPAPVPIETPATQALPDNLRPAPASTPAQPAPQATSGQSVPAQPAIPAATPPAAPVTVLEDTLIRVRTTAPISTRASRDGMPVEFTLSEDVLVNNLVVIPRGALIHGEVVQSKKSGVLTGSPELTLKLVSLDLGGKSYPLYTYLFTAQGASKTKPTETKIKTGTVVGAIVGGVFSGSTKGATAVGKLAGAGTGAALGAGVGTAVSAVTPGPVLAIPAEAQLDFQLASPIAVEPLSAADAARLANRLHPGDPVLYIRGETP